MGGRAEPQGVEYLDHTADVGILARGRSVDEAFRRAAEGLFALMVRLDAVRPSVRRPVRCRAASLQELLVEWLSALLAERDLGELVFGRFEAAIEEGEGGVFLHGAAFGEALDPSRHEPGIEVKVISFLGLSVDQEREGDWVAACVVDV